MLKLTVRSIRSFMGRYLALVMIVALGAGFFSGLKITQKAMVNTAQKYYDRHALYDFRVFSTVGFTQDEVDRIAAHPGVENADGTTTMDVLVRLEDADRPFRLMGISEKVNTPSLVSGRWPEKNDECLADDAHFDESDIRSRLVLSEGQEEETPERLKYGEYTIVGLADSPLYLNLDRGTADIGSGTVFAFAYIPQDTFTVDVFSEVNITLSETGPLYSQDYNDRIDAQREEITHLCSELSVERYNRLLSQVTVPSFMEAAGITAAQIAEKAGLTDPEVYVLARNENVGYLNFENDTAIISGIANVFPLFFILIAMLVCSATMSRMVEEERTQIGVLKAMGYGNGAVISKYLLYAGSATLLGWCIGYFLCTWGLPRIFWYAFRAVYDFAPIGYLFSPGLAGLTLAVSLLCILGSAVLSCRRALTETSAQLIRPRAAQKGKRVLLERMGFLWNRLSFLQKITLRNMFRYKRRMFMMLVGVGCCAALVLTGFGVRDSMVDIGRLQFGRVQTYDLEASFEEKDGNILSEKLQTIPDIGASMTAAYQYADLYAETAMKSVVLMAFPDGEDAGGFWNFRQGTQPAAYPGAGEAVINGKIAEKLGLSPGKTVEIRTSDMQRCTVRISGIFDNYIGNFILISGNTYADLYGTCKANTLLIRTEGDAERIAGQLTGMDGIKGVTQLSVTEKGVNDALSCLNYIIWLIVLFSGALAFVVIYNLTIINIAERNREIATVQVLGFFPGETEGYVLRENLILSVLATAFGLPLGYLFHQVVMRMISINSLTFDIHIAPVSYVLAFLCTVIFSLIVNSRMKRQVNRIKMTESLKAVE